MQRMGMERQLLDTIRKRQWKFVKHLLREEGGMERYIIETEMTGERARGRQRMKLLDWMMKKMDVRDGRQLADIARDRSRWRKDGTT